MPAPKGQIAILADSLKVAPTLKTVQGLRILYGRKKFAIEGHPPRIVLMPHKGNYSVPIRKTDTVMDVDLRLLVHLWAADPDDAADLEKRFWNAMDYVAAQNGVFWPRTDGSADVEWDTDPDTSSEGQEILISLRVRLAMDRGLSRGVIDAVKLEDENDAIPDIIITPPPEP